MNIVLRTLAGLIGVLFIYNAAQWLFAPAIIAKNLGMPLLTGIGASTQIGDFTSFFFVGGVLILLGLRIGKSGLLLAPAMLLGSAAVFRTLAFLSGNADFAANFIIFESVVTAILATCIYYLPKLDNS